MPEAIDFLTSLLGIDNWMTQMLAIRVLGEGDAFPANDLALRKAATLSDSLLISSDELIKRAETWRPWRAYAAHLLCAETQ